MPKINKDSTLNITFVGIGLCLLCSAIISFIAIQLRSVQENNVVLDMQKKIVSSAGLEKVYGSVCLLYTSPSPRDYAASRMPSSA